MSSVTSSIPVGLASTSSPSPTVPTSRSPTRYGLPGGLPHPPVTCPPPSQIAASFPGPNAEDGESRGRGAVLKGGVERDGKMLLELADGTAYEGYGFGRESSISGECVFQTGKSISTRLKEQRIWREGIKTRRWGCCTRDNFFKFAASNLKL